MECPSLRRRIPSSPYSQLLWKSSKVGTCACPSVTSQMISLPRRYSQQRTSKHHPVPAAVHCCDELFTQMCSIAPGDPIFMSYSFVFVFGFTRPPRFLLFYFVVIKKILSTKFFLSSCSSSGCRRSLSVNSNQFPT